LAAIHDWPVFWNMLRVAHAAAASRSASASTTNGSLPPSSSTVFFTARPAIAATARPAPVEPVNVTAATRSSVITPSLTSGVRSTLETISDSAPAGSPACSATSGSSSEHPVVDGGCLSTIAVPASSARTTCQ
jgi:hypothetical protein